MRTVAHYLDALYEAQQRSMQQLLEAWDREIEAQKKSALEAQRKLFDQQANEDIESAAFERRLIGLVIQAQAGCDVSISIPSGIRVAAALAAAPEEAELEHLTDVVAHASRDPDLGDQRSAAWALSHGFMPHPGDLASLLSKAGVDSDYRHRFQDLSHALDAIAQRPVSHPQLAVVAAQEKLTTLRDQVSLMKAYSPERVLSLVSRPETLGGTAARVPAPSAPPSAARLSPRALNRVLDGLFA